MRFLLADKAKAARIFAGCADREGVTIVLQGYDVGATAAIFVSTDEAQLNAAVDLDDAGFPIIPDGFALSATFQLQPTLILHRVSRALFARYLAQTTGAAGGSKTILSVEVL